MRLRPTPFLLAMLLGLITLATWGQNSTQSQIGYRPSPDANQKKTLLLKDFHPTSMLHVPAHRVERAPFYVIDVHNHTNDAVGIGDRLPPSRVIEIMDQTNVKTVVILTGMWGEKLQHVIDTMVKPYPGRFMVFTQLDWSKIDDSDFSHEMVLQLDDAVSRGARGLKFLKDLGLGVRDKSGKLIVWIQFSTNVDASAFLSLFIPAIPKRSSFPSMRRTSDTKS
jgi:hypothetical protein